MPNFICSICKKEFNRKNNYDYHISDSKRDFNLTELSRIEHLEKKQSGLLEIALEKFKDELYNGRDYCKKY